MSHAVHTHRDRQQRYTVTEADVEAVDDAWVARTKRYAFYWLAADRPVLLAVRDYDGRDVTDSVNPPEGMCEAVGRA